MPLGTKLVGGQEAGPSHCRASSACAVAAFRVAQGRVERRHADLLAVVSEGLDLRHSHATLLLHEGVNVKAVSARLGHASAAMTLDRYAHALPAAETQAIAAVDAVLGA